MSDFEDKVRSAVDALERGDIAAMSGDIMKKRMAWLDAALPGKPGHAEYSPRQVFEILFFEYMGLERKDLPVIFESSDRIEWLSRNRCPLLEACRISGLDTRATCKAVNEESTRAFVSRINPSLSFHRSYEEIRPHADFCREWISRD